MKIVVTGTGRVANGAVEVLDHMGIRRVSPKAFLENSYEEAVYTQLDCKDYAAPKDADKSFDLQEFFQHPDRFKSTFAPYTKVADLMINGIYWANEAPVFFTAEDMQQEDFNIRFFFYNVIKLFTCETIDFYIHLEN